MTTDEPGFAIVWTYDVPVEQRARFEETYGPAGAWVQLFRRGEGYAGTELVRCDTENDTEGGDYVTVDRWTSRAAYEAFMTRWRDEYGHLDDELSGLTEAERLLGRGDVIRRRS